MESSENKATEDFDLILLIAVRQFLAGKRFEEMLDWFANSVPVIAPDWAAQFGNDEGLLRALGLQVIRYVWTNAPDPELGFATRRLEKPQRNQPCPCGSGRKYKHCCQPLPDLAGALSNISLLPYVLGHLTRKELQALPFDRFDPRELAHVARVWMGKDRPQDAEALLEGYFRNAKRLDHRAEWAFDLLMDLYLELHHPRKRKRLLEQALASEDRRLRAAALHRQCLMLADEGEIDEAWKVFVEAQRLDPENPSLSHLEVVLLVSQNRAQEAAERARFWIARLRRANAPEHEPLIELLEPFAEDPVTASLSASRDGEAATRILRLLEASPRPACHYSLTPEQGDAGPLQPVGELADLESAWRKQVPDPWDTHNRKKDWLAWVEKHPGTLDSFEVLHDLVMLAGQFDLLDPVIDRIQRPLLERGARLLRQVIEANGAEDCRLEWGWLENRPALWLVGELAIRLVEEDPERAAALMEWLVLTLNPNDNQGLRGTLAHLYVQLGEPDKAIALCERYPDDFAVMQYARALALHVAGQTDEALAALSEARRNYPKVLKTLLAKNPRPPRMRGYGVTVGGDDEAWIYRVEFRSLWERTGALDWAKSVRRSLK